MVIFVFAFLLRARSYLPRATCSAVAWNGWNGSPGEEGNGALVPPAASFSSSFHPGTAAPSSRQAIAGLPKAKGTPLLQHIQLHISRYNAILIVGRKESVSYRWKEKISMCFLSNDRALLPSAQNTQEL